MKKFIKFFGPSGDLDDLWPSLVEFRCCGETHRNQLSCFSLKKTKLSSARSVHPTHLPPLVINTVVFYFVKWRSTYIIWCIDFIDHISAGISEQNWNSAQRKSFSHFAYFMEIFPSSSPHLLVQLCPRETGNAQDGHTAYQERRLPNSE